jgi:TetR/AcrR family transcriptional regulator, regulator of cefoperazone and chloramphenicol sensitivity
MEFDMKSVKRQDNGIQGRLIKSACEVFAEKGYRDATVAEICERAGANVAAINYYFGNKEKLYVEAWRVAFQRSLEIYPPDGGVGPKAPAEQRLRGRIFSIVKRFADPKCYEFEIIRKELATPTGLLSEVLRESIEPLRHELGSIVRELLGAGASEQQVLLCQMSIKAQCFDIWIRERFRDTTSEEEVKNALLPEALQIEVIVDHITRFSLAGIREIRQQIESGELNDVGRNSEVRSVPVSVSTLKSRGHSNAETMDVVSNKDPID